MTDVGTWRRINGTETREAERIYQGSIDYSRVRIYNMKFAFWQPDNTAMAPNGNIYFPPPIFREDFSVSTGDMAFLVHELGHVWQTQHGIWLRFRRVLVEGGVYDYGQLNADRALNSYTVEQQASILADWYLIASGASAQHGSGSEADYAKIVRRAIPAQQRR